MPSPSEYQAAISKSSVNMDRIDRFVNGTPIETVETDNGPISTLAKLQADVGLAGDTVENALRAENAANEAEAFADDAAAAANNIQDLTVQIQSRNLYNPATMRISGQLVANNGTISSVAGWAYIKIPVVPGQAYSWASNTTRRVGSAFLDAGSVGLSPSTYDGTIAIGVLSQSRIAPAGAAFLAINILSPEVAEPTEMMVNEGTGALPFEAYFTPFPLIRQSKVLDDFEGGFVPEFADRYESPNLYDPTKRINGQLVASTSPVISAATGWATTDWIEVTPGESYTISWLGNKRPGVLFTAAYGASSGIAGSLDNRIINPLTVVPPVGATHMILNVQSDIIPEPANLMINRGSAALNWEPFGTEVRIRKGRITPDIIDLDGRMTKARLMLSSSTVAGSTSFSCPLGGSVFTQRLSPFPPKNSRWLTQAWNYQSYLRDGVAMSDSAVDDIAPFRLLGTTLGANHGYMASRETVTAHGKTLADVGSVYASGGVEWVILDISDANTIAITRRSGNSTFTGGTLTHVSGGTNTASFTPSARIIQQWYPSIKNRRLRLIIDGIEVDNFDATYFPQRQMVWAESYQIMEKNSIVEWLITQAGTSTFIEHEAFEGTAMVDVTISYAFDMDGGQTIATDILALANVSPFQDAMFVQMGRMGAVGGVLDFVIPDTLPVVHETISSDFSRRRNMVGWSTVARLNFPPATWADPNYPPNRVIQLNGLMGYAVGYLPVQDAAPVARIANVARKALQLGNTAKIYLSAVDSTSRTSLAAGESFGVVAYKVPFLLHPHRTASYVVRGPDADWLFVDWHASVSDRVSLPADLHGRSFTEFRKTGGVEVRSKFATDSVAFSVTTSGGAGQYAILRFAK